MRSICLLLFILVCFTVNAHAQSPDARVLTTEGNELARQKNYTAAIDKYKAALAIDTGYAPANYQMAYTLNSSGKGLDAIPYLQRVFRSKDASVKLLVGSYSLAGSIYDQNNKPKQAIAIYESGVKALDKADYKADIQPLFYNLSLAYFRSKQYETAENFSKVIISFDSTNANSQRVYALVTFHQNKRAEALLGFCSFLLLEPNTARSAEAYGNIEHVLQGGALKPEPGQSAIKPDANTIALNLAITKSQTVFATRRYASAGDLFAAKLTAAITAIDETNKRKGVDLNHWDTFFYKRYSNYFVTLAQSPNMPAFARLITQSQPESAKWIKDHPKEMTDLEAWLKATPRWR